jgi:hypothetical protein
VIAALFIATWQIVIRTRSNEAGAPPLTF